MKSEVRIAPVFSKIVYAQAWEDPMIDVDAFGGIGADDDVFAIGASGDQTLCFTTFAPRSVVALDFNLTQCVLLELKIRAIERLSWGEMLEFLGVCPSGRRAAYYDRLRGDLTPKAREFWDANPEVVRKGVIHSGRFENYFRIFRWTVLRLIYSRRTIRKMVDCASTDEQRERWAKEWNTWRLRALFGLFFNKRVMAALGRSEAHFKYVTLEQIQQKLLERARIVLTEIPTRGNYFLEYILTGDYRDERLLPEYLLEENHPKLRRYVDRITIVNDEIEAFLPRYADGAFSKFYLSDIFEYMAEGPFETLLKELWRTGREGAVLSYRNLFAPRSRPDGMKELLEPNDELGRRLNLRDRSFFYDRQIVETVRKARVPASALKVK